jgi:quercetin dioxygenase-like cupin family protein
MKYFLKTLSGQADFLARRRIEYQAVLLFRCWTSYRKIKFLSSTVRGRTTKPLLKATRTVIGQRLIYPRKGTPAIESMIVEIAPGGESGWHLHPYPTYVYVLQGTLHVELEGGRRHKIGRGRAALEVTRSWHNAKNRGKRPLKLLMVYAGLRAKSNLNRRKP